MSMAWCELGSTGATPISTPAVVRKLTQPVGAGMFGATVAVRVTPVPKVPGLPATDRLVVLAVVPGFVGAKATPRKAVLAGAVARRTGVLKVAMLELPS